MEQRRRACTLENAGALYGRWLTDHFSITWLL